MKFGLIGKNLGHSYSKSIHESLFINQYELKSIDQIEDIKDLSLDGYNVTIPYKNLIIPYLDHLDNLALKTKSVNTVIKKDHKLYGYNTDYFGFKAMVSLHKINFNNKKVIILGNGATSRTIEFFLKEEKVDKIQKLVRHIRGDSEDYFENQNQYSDYEIIINTTPVGMYPNEEDKSLINFYHFPHCKLVIDIIYNPYRTNLLLQAKKFDIKAINGLYMLIMQAKKSQEILFNKFIPNQLIHDTYKHLIKTYTNLVLIGMPTSGKSTIGKILSNHLHMDYIDTDHLIEKYSGIKISQIFKLYGENAFRKIEENIYQSLLRKQGSIISCGGGVILNQKNIDVLKHQGIVIFIDKDLTLLKENNTLSRPLLNHKRDFDKLYKERYNLYKEASDITIKIDGKHEFTIERLMRLIYEYINC